MIEDLILSNLHWLAFLISTIGTVFVISRHASVRLKGYEIWIWGNVIWVIWAFNVGNQPVLMINVVYAAISFIGIWHNIPQTHKEDLSIPPKNSS